MYFYVKSAKCMLDLFYRFSGKFSNPCTSTSIPKYSKYETTDLKQN